MLGLSRRSFAEASLVLAGQGAYVIGGLVLAKVLSNLLGPVGYGQWSLLYSVVGVIMVSVHGPMGQWLLRYYSVMKEDQLEVYYGVRDTFLWIGAASALALPVFLVSDVSFGLLVLLGAPVLAFLAGNIYLLQNIYTAQRRRGKAAAVVGVDVWARVLLAGVGIYLWGPESPFWIFLFGMGSLVTAFLFWTGRRSVRSTLDSIKKLPWGSISKYSLPFLGLGLLGAATTQADKWLVAFSVSELDLGYYSAAVVVALTPCHLLGFLVSQLFTPVVFDAAEGEKNSGVGNQARVYLWKAVGLLLLLGVGLLLTVYLWGHLLIVLITSPEYLPAKSLLIPLVISGVIFQFSQILSIAAMVASDSRSILWVKALHAASFLTLALVLVGRHGTVAVAYSHLISSVILAGASVVTWRKYLW